MCWGCWVEYGQPKDDNEAVRQLAMLLDSADHYGALHIVVEDWNIETEHLEWCAKNASEHDRAILALMLPMSEARRASAMALANQFWTA